MVFRHSDNISTRAGFWCAQPVSVDNNLRGSAHVH